VIEKIDDLYGHCDLVQDNINRAFGSNRDFLHLTLAIEEMEMVVGRAIAGEAPDASTSGPIRASDFLPIVQDVTSWAVTNFEAFNARPAAEELPLGISGTGSPYFRKAPRFDRHTTPMTVSELYLRSTILPFGARRCGGPTYYSPSRTPAATQ
jgi:hypothetical protein